MAGVKQMFLLIIFQGFYLSSVCQYWTFHSSITALIGSCVEIPCTYRPAGTSEPSSTVWYLYKYMQRHPEILNTGDSSSVMAEYRDRTSLVPGENSCSLRIDPVRRRDHNKFYYPGDGNMNAFRTQYGTVHLNVTDSPGNLILLVSETIREGEAAIIQCAAVHTCRPRPPSLRWNKPGQVRNKSVEFYVGYWGEVSELTYIPSYVDDGSPVQCSATYHNGRKSEESRRLNIEYVPKNVTVTIPGNDKVMEGSDITLQCSSFSNPAVYEYEWYKGKTKLPDRGREITVRKVTWNMEPYSCAAINHLGRGESAPTEIPVQYAAIGVHITVKKEHGFSELICDFLSSRPDVTHYTWMKDGSILHNETEKTLTIHSNEENYGQYSCIAHNSAGNSSSEEISRKYDRENLPLIWGTFAGIFFLIVLILAIYFSVRKKCKSYFAASVTRSVFNTIEENIHNDRSAQPDSMRSISSVDVNVTGNCAIYSNI